LGPAAWPKITSPAQTSPSIHAIFDQFGVCAMAIVLVPKRIFRPQLDTLNHTHLSDIIPRNTTVANVQTNVFFFNVAFPVGVFNDANAAPRRRGEGGVLFWRPTLDTDGNILQTTTTNSQAVLLHRSGPGTIACASVARMVDPNHQRSADILAAARNVLGVIFGFSNSTQPSANHGCPPIQFQTLILSQRNPRPNRGFSWADRFERATSSYRTRSTLSYDPQAAKTNRTRNLNPLISCQRC